MVEAKATVQIQACANDVWKYIVRLEDWWLRSNPNEHIELSLIDSNKIEEGTQFILKEYIAGVRGEAIAEISKLTPLKKLVWSSKKASYTLLGITFNVDEGGTFESTENNGVCTLSHHVWGSVKNPIIGRFVEMFFKHILQGERKDYEHTRSELQFVKNEIESQNS